MKSKGNGIEQIVKSKGNQAAAVSNADDQNTSIDATAFCVICFPS